MTKRTDPNPAIGCGLMLVAVAVVALATKLELNLGAVLGTLLVLAIVLGIGLRARQRAKRERLEAYRRRLVRCPNCGLKTHRRRVTTGELVCASCGFVWYPQQYGQDIYD